MHLFDIHFTGQNQSLKIVQFFFLAIVGKLTF